jgi:DNA repair exonuclease SbcCD nuclease subunit
LKTLPKKLLLFADLHLGVHQNSPKWHQLALEWAKWAKDIAKKEGAEAIVCLGDYFHDRDQIDVSTLDIARKILNTFSEFEVYLITGNHDIYFKEKNDVTSLHIFQDYPYVNVINETKKFKFQEFQINMVPWTEYKNEKAYNADVILTHAEFKNFRLNNCKYCEEGLELDKHQNEQKYILAGHFHISDVKNYQKLKAGYLGNPFQHNFADINNNKYVYVLDLEKMNLKSFENEFSPQHEIVYFSKNQTPKRKNSIVRIIYDISDATEKYMQYANFIQENYQPFTLLTQTDFEIKNNNVNNQENISFEQMLTDFISKIEIQHKKETLDYCSNLYKRCC